MAALPNILSQDWMANNLKQETLPVDLTRPLSELSPQIASLYQMVTPKALGINKASQELASDMNDITNKSPWSKSINNSTQNAINSYIDYIDPTYSSRYTEAMAARDPALGQFADIALPLVLSAVLPGLGTGLSALMASSLGAAAGAGLSGALQGRDIGDIALQAALAGGGSYLGGSALQGLGGTSSGFTGPHLGDAMSALVDSTAGIGSSLGSSLGSTAGSVAAPIVVSAAQPALAALAPAIGGAIGAAAPALSSADSAAPSNQDITVTGQPSSAAVAPSDFTVPDVAPIAVNLPEVAPLAVTPSTPAQTAPSNQDITVTGNPTAPVAQPSDLAVLADATLPSDIVVSAPQNTAPVAQEQPSLTVPALSIPSYNAPAVTPSDITVTGQQTAPAQEQPSLVVPTGPLVDLAANVPSNQDIVVSQTQPSAPAQEQPSLVVPTGPLVDLAANVPAVTGINDIVVSNKPTTQVTQEQPSLAVASPLLNAVAPVSDTIVSSATQPSAPAQQQQPSLAVATPALNAVAPVSDTIVSSANQQQQINNELAAALGNVPITTSTLPLDTLPTTPAATNTSTQSSKVSDLATALKIGGLASSLLGGITGATGGSGSNGTYTGAGTPLPSNFSATLPAANIPGLTGGAAGAGTVAGANTAAFANKTPQDWYRYGYGPAQSFFSYVPQGLPNTSTAYTGYAHGGDVSHDRAPTDFAVHGEGDGRSDDIPAMLSDGEYVMDAETVALLGNGSNKAGAKRLDDLRVNLRKQKGRELVKGKFSVKAKSPEHYLAGGRT